MKRKLGLLAPRPGATTGPDRLRKFGQLLGLQRRRRRWRQQRDQLLDVGRQSAAGVPEMCGRVPDRESRSHGQDRAVRLGRLLDEADHRLRVRNRAGRVHRPPAEVPGVRQAGPVGGAGRPDQAGQRRHDPVRRGPGRRLEGQRRQAVRPAEGLRHGRHLLQQGHGGRGRRHAGAVGHHGMESRPTAAPTRRRSPS